MASLRTVEPIFRLGFPAPACTSISSFAVRNGQILKAPNRTQPEDRFRLRHRSGTCRQYRQPHKPVLQPRHKRISHLGGSRKTSREVLRLPGSSAIWITIVNQNPSALFLAFGAQFVEQQYDRLAAGNPAPSPALVAVAEKLRRNYRRAMRRAIHRQPAPSPRADLPKSRPAMERDSGLHCGIEIILAAGNV